MKKVCLSLFGLFVLIGIVSTQEYLVLSDIVWGPTPAPNRTPNMSVIPYRLEANASGGVAEVVIRHKVGANQFCPATYRFEWRFSQSVEVLQKDQPVSLQTQVNLLSAPCKAGKGRMIAHAAAGWSEAFTNLNIRNGGGISLKPANWIEATEQRNSAQNTSVMTLFNTFSDYSTIRINLESSGYVGSEKIHFEIIYVFAKKARETHCDQDLQAHNLYSVGVLLAFAEYGAFKNDNPQFLAQQLDGAIEHAIASRCIPTDEISKMAQQLRTATSSLPFHPNLTRLRDDLARYAERNCNCCQ